MLSYAGLLVPVALVDGAGNAQGRQVVDVLNVDGTTATVYADAARTALTGAVASDATGNVSGVYAEPGVYRLRFSVLGVSYEVQTVASIDPREITDLHTLVTGNTGSVSAEAAARTAADSAESSARAAADSAEAALRASGDTNEASTRAAADAAEAALRASLAATEAADAAAAATANGNEVTARAAAVLAEQNRALAAEAANAASIALKAPLASPALTGTPTVNGAPVETTTHAAAAYASLTPTGQQALATASTAKVQKFRAGLGNRNLGRCSIAMIGDSVTMGQGASVHANGTPSRLGVNLRSRFPQTPAGGRGFIGAVNAGVVGPFAWPAVLAGSPSTAVPGYGPARASVTLNSGTKTVTFTLNGTDADIMFVKFSGAGVGYYTVDGGSATTFSCSKTGSLQDGFTQRVSLGAAGAHTLVVGWSSGGNVVIDGVIEYNGDASTGILTHNCGWSGSKTTDWINAGSPEWAQGLAALAPDLVIIELGLNDSTNSIDATATQANLTTLIATIRAAMTAPYPPIILDAAWGRGAVAAATWATYANAMYAIAAADASVLVYDETLRFPYPLTSYTDATIFGLLSDAVHPSDKGHQARADALLGYLLSLVA